MGHCSNILQLPTHRGLKPAKRHLQGHSLVHMAWLCVCTKCPWCVFRVKASMKSFDAEMPSFQYSLLVAPDLVPWWEHMLARAGDGSSLCLGGSGVGLYIRDFICPSGPNGTPCLGNQPFPQNHSWQFRASGHQDCVLFGAPGTVSRAECTESFFLSHSTGSLTSNWTLLFFFFFYIICFVLVTGKVLILLSSVVSM